VDYRKMYNATGRWMMPGWQREFGWSCSRKPEI